MKQGEYRILLVDDEPDVLEFIGYSLRREGYEVFTATSGDDAVKTALAELPHLILMDVMMPGKDGVQTCEEMRTLPQLDGCIIAFLTARSEEFSQIAGFEAGGDDYISKPVKPRLLQTRIKALLKRSRMSSRHAAAEKPENADTGTELVIDREQYTITVRGKVMTLPRKEFELLSVLMSRPGRVFTRSEILDRAWGDDTVVGDRTIDVHIRKLREKIGDSCIKTLKGIGYKFTG